jgi:hypothetical protein
LDGQRVEGVGFVAGEGQGNEVGIGHLAVPG